MPGEKKDVERELKGAKGEKIRHGRMEPAGGEGR